MMRAAQDEMVKLTERPETRRAVLWSKSNLFSSPFNTVLTLVAAYVLVSVVVAFVDWAIIGAVYRGSDEVRLPRTGCGRLLALHHAQDGALHVRALSGARTLARRPHLRPRTRRPHPA